jgi:hypothetical protein
MWDVPKPDMGLFRALLVIMSAQPAAIRPVKTRRFLKRQALALRGNEAFYGRVTLKG